MIDLSDTFQSTKLCLYKLTVLVFTLLELQNINLPILQTQTLKSQSRMSPFHCILIFILYYYTTTAFVALPLLISFPTPTLYEVKLTEYPDALCLDGSHASYYISESGDPKKWFIAFAGGGWCYGPNGTGQIIEDCYQRSKTQYGSTKHDQRTLTFTEGVLSTNSENNFKDWKRVFLKYCDGSGHQGTRANPIEYKGTKLYFRGHNITVAQLDSLEKHHKLFSEATHVVVGGFSAGGLAAFTWVNYIKERVKIGKVWGMPDSGIFLDSTNVTSGQNDYKKSFKNLVALVNTEISNPMAQCSSKYDNEPQKCMFAENLFQFSKVPLFAIQSLYDEWSIQNIVGIKCVKQHSLIGCSQSQADKVQQYHRNMSSVVLAIGKSNVSNGYWAPVCVFHCLSQEGWYYNQTYRIPEYSQNSIMRSVVSWMDNKQAEQYRFMDEGKWPQNNPCAGRTRFKAQIDDDIKLTSKQSLY